MKEVEIVWLMNLNNIQLSWCYFEQYLYAEHDNPNPLL